MTRSLGAISLFCVTAATSAAQTATVSVTHNHPTGLVQPGETIRITWEVDWSGGFQFARIAGDALATPNVGVAGPGSANLGSGPLISFGTPAAGSVRNVDVGSSFWPAFYFNFLFVVTPITFLEYDWTAPSDPGVVEFSWAPSPAVPEPLVFTSFLSFQWVPLTTTYVGASVVVTPSPAAASVIAVAGALAWRRRGRP